ncbi:MAG: radical SAM protein [Acidobacteriota bacterium]|nr:radical SAM protein [Acidobacteriota bacterium]
MNVIYEPKGRAREYSELACNLYRGCTHGCRYCYAPSCMRTSADKWHAKAEPREKVLEMLEKDASRLRGDSRRVLFCFLSDPYQPIERQERLTRRALEIVARNELRSQILTKGSADLILEDLDLMKQSGTELGVTLCFSDDETRKAWEPNASTVMDRLSVLRIAHQAGIHTWVSLEPVIDPIQALEVIRTAHGFVDFWKVGKLNHMKDIESQIDWRKFLIEAKRLLDSVGADYYVKDDLRRYGL